MQTLRTRVQVPGESLVNMTLAFNSNTVKGKDGGGLWGKVANTLALASWAYGRE